MQLGAVRAVVRVCASKEWAIERCWSRAILSKARGDHIESQHEQKCLNLAHTHTYIYMRHFVRYNFIASSSKQVCEAGRLHRTPFAFSFPQPCQANSSGCGSTDRSENCSALQTVGCPGQWLSRGRGQNG